MEVGQTRLFLNPGHPLPDLSQTPGAPELGGIVQIFPNG
jgi:hypothetical protein